MYNKKIVIKKRFLIFTILVIVILYVLSWVIYDVEYSNNRLIVLQHYGGLNTYKCTGTAELGQPKGLGYIKIHPTSYLFPFEGISYTIEYGSGPNISTGRVSLLGKIKQTHMQYSSDPLCTLL